MEPFPTTPQTFFERNRIMIKGIIMGFLILFMLIPTLFVNSLVQERKMRQQQIAEEVSSKWSGAQTISGPYIYVPYTTVTQNGNLPPQTVKQSFFILPEDLNVTGNISHTIRKRSIYNVLLYTASIKQLGRFVVKAPADIDAASIQWKDAELCFGISDFRGIEEKIVINFRGKEHELSPGLPTPYIGLGEKGLSCPIDISASDLNQSFDFGMHVRAKGSENLKLVPLAGNSNYKIQSAWPSPSFTGFKLPDNRTISDTGFQAEWKFNKANLPYATVLLNNKAADLNIDFGITLLQPTDQYAKTERSVKYALLFIGLTFGLFFIVEITRKKPVHPLQYMLIGLALVIFYTLLLSISEFIHFDVAYAIAAVAVITMITLYSRQLFGDRKSTLITFAILTLQYLFIFVLIRLEDTALLVGSIGLFIVLGLIMYASRNIDWYGTKEATNNE